MRATAVVTACVVCAGTIAQAQKPPAIRQIGRLERVTTDSLASANAAVQLRDGRVLVHDVRSRRVILFDSTLSHPRLIADTTGATANAYSRQNGSLFGYRNDSALFADVGSLSMLVIGPTGAIARVMAIPRPNDAQRLYNINGVPGIDAGGRLVYRAAAGLEGVITQCCLGSQERALDSLGRPLTGKYTIPKPDSAFVVAVHLDTRAPDTIATIRIAYTRQRVVFDNQSLLTAIEQTRLPLPVVDGWAVLRDGSIAVVRGRDYHVDWFDARGRSSSPKLPFAWERLDDTRKLAIIDSEAKLEQAQADERDRLRAGQPAGRGVAGISGGRGGGGGRGDGAPGPAERAIPAIIVPAELADLPDYVPPFSANAVYADADNNLWIRTSTLVDGRPVYDLVNRRGELFDRVQLPSFRTIAGFGPGVVYMAVQGSSGVVRLERARIR
jgi:hypothetical protein